MTRGLNLIIYPSTLLGASRVQKLGTSLQRADDFDETHLVGIQAGHLAAREPIAEGVTVVRISGSARTGPIGRVLKVLLWQPRVYRHYRKHPVAVVGAQNVWILPMCWLLARRTGAPLAYNPHELETETSTMRGLKRWVARRIERRYINRASVISVVSDAIADWYEDTYGIERPIVVNNLPVMAPGTADLRSKIGLRGEDFLYIHTGHLVADRNIPLILREFKSRPQLHLVFLGDGPLRNLVDDAAAHHINIHRLDPVTPSDVVPHVRAADAALCLTEPTGISNQRACPNKLMEALAAGTPPLCTDLIEARRRLGQAADTWVLADPEDELGPALDRISVKDVADFRSSWHGLPAWDEQVAPLVATYRELTNP